MSAIEPQRSAPRCDICLEDLKETDLKEAAASVSRTKCLSGCYEAHKTHKVCIEEWFSRKNECPFCKTKDPLNNGKVGSEERISRESLIERSIQGAGDSIRVLVPIGIGMAALLYAHRHIEDEGVLPNAMFGTACTVSLISMYIAFKRVAILTTNLIRYNRDIYRFFQS